MLTIIMQREKLRARLTSTGQLHHEKVDWYEMKLLFYCVLNSIV